MIGYWLYNKLMLRLCILLQFLSSEIIHNEGSYALETYLGKYHIKSLLQDGLMIKNSGTKT